MLTDAGLISRQGVEAGLAAPSEDARKNGLKLGFTHDRSMLRKYRDFREALYEKDSRFVGFRIVGDDESGDGDDPDDQMLILERDGECYGGLCLRVSTPQRRVVLHLEHDILPSSGKERFFLHEQFPEYELDKCAYAELGRTVIHPSLRSPALLKRIFKEAMERCMSYRVSYLFGMGDRARTRIYKQIHSNFGVHVTIPENFDIPMREEFEGVKMYLLCGDMKHLVSATSNAAAQTPAKPESELVPIA